jgi:hypothetical protein
MENNMQQTQEEQIRISIIPQLNSLANNLWDNMDEMVSPKSARRLDKIIDELTNILNNNDTSNS